YNLLKNEGLHTDCAKTFGLFIYLLVLVDEEGTVRADPVSRFGMPLRLLLGFWSNVRHEE
ncbi:hypothetical protein ACJX0J_037778, partial [Zea mays]